MYRWTVVFLSLLFLATGCAHESVEECLQVREAGGVIMEFSADFDEVPAEDIERALSNLRTRLKAQQLNHFVITASDPSREGALRIDSGSNRVSPAKEKFSSPSITFEFAFEERCDDPNEAQEKGDAIVARVLPLLKIRNIEFLVLADSVRDASALNLPEGQDNDQALLAAEESGDIRWLKHSWGAEDEERVVPEDHWIIRDAATKEQLNGGLLSSAQRANSPLPQPEDIEIAVLGSDIVTRLDAREVSSVSKVSDSNGMTAVSFSMTEHGGAIMTSITGRYAPTPQQSSYLAIVAEGRIILTPKINSVIGREVLLQGVFSESEVDGLVDLFNQSTFFDLGNPRDVSFVVTPDSARSDDSEGQNQ